MSNPTHNPVERSKKPHPANTLLPYYGSKAATTSLALPFRLTTAGFERHAYRNWMWLLFENELGNTHPHTTQRILRRITLFIKLLSATNAVLSAAIIAMLAPHARAPRLLI